MVLQSYSNHLLCNCQCTLLKERVCNVMQQILYHYLSIYTSKVTAPQDAHKQFSAAGFPWLKHFRIQWYVGKSFVMQQILYHYFSIYTNFGFLVSWCRLAQLVKFHW